MRVLKNSKTKGRTNQCDGVRPDELDVIEPSVEHFPGQDLIREVL